MVVDDGTGKIVRRRVRGRRRVWALPAALAALLALAGCGRSGYDTGALARDITARLDQHPGWAVRSVRCPQHASRGKGVVIRCSATLRDGRVVRLRATQLDGKGTIHLVANEVSLGSFPPFLVVVTAVVGTLLAAAGGRIARTQHARAVSRRPA